MEQPIVTGDEKLVNDDAPKFSTFRPRTVFGVDFSGAAMAGQNAWIAEFETVSHGTARESLRLVDLQPLGRAAGGESREVVYAYLVNRILTSNAAIWGMDFPFGLPIELGLGDWSAQLQHVTNFPGDAKSYGRHLVDLARRVGDAMHIRRSTDQETKTPFDCYHYRIIYQTFHGMRDVLAKIAGEASTLTLPFESNRHCELRTTIASENQIRRIVMEACPSSTLKRLELPHRNYKQSGGKSPTEQHQRTRRAIFKTILGSIELSAHRRRVIMRNPGGDALDAVIAGLGVWEAWQRDDHVAIASHDRYPIEGRVYC